MCTIFLVIAYSQREKQNNEKYRTFCNCSTLLVGRLIGGCFQLVDEHCRSLNSLYCNLFLNLYMLMIGTSIEYSFVYIILSVWDF